MLQLSFTLSVFAFVLFSLLSSPSESFSDSIGFTTTDLAFTVSIIMWMLVGSCLFFPKVKKCVCKGGGGQFRKNCFSSRSSLKTCSMSFPLTQLLLLCFCFLFFFLQCYTCFFFCFFLHLRGICFLSILYSMQYSNLIQSAHSNNKRESFLSAICHFLSWIQQLSVGCSIFLIVANFLVQFYATFTWMFMTLSAATKI